MSGGHTSIGTRIYRDTLKDSSGESWQEIAELNTVQFPDKTREVVDVSHLNVTNQYRIFKSGFRDAGRVIFNINYDKTQYERLNEDYNDNDPILYKIVLGDSAASEFIFEGFLVRLGGSAPEGSSKDTCDIEIKLTGQPEAEPS